MRKDQYPPHLANDKYYHYHMVTGKFLSYPQLEWWYPLWVRIRALF
jgi:hypothetical protein